MIKISNGIIFLCLISCSALLGQEYIEYIYLDRNKSNHQLFLDLCDYETRNEYARLANTVSDSITIYAEGFRKGTELYISTDNEMYIVPISKHYLIHQRYLDYIVLSKEELSSSSSLTVRIKFDYPDNTEYSYDYQFTIAHLNSKILDSKSLVIGVNKSNDEEEKRHAILGYSQVDEVVFEKMKKNCAQKARKSNGPD